LFLYREVLERYLDLEGLIRARTRPRLPVVMTHALERKYRHANRQWGWQWVFPQRNRWKDAATAKEGRHHLDPSQVKRR
jgi:hypothetical protein